MCRSDAYEEPQTTLCSAPVDVKIAALQGQQERARVSVRVLPVHTFFTTGANADFQMDYNYLDWKYAAVLATTGGAFTGGVTISTNGCVPCPRFPLDPNPPCAYACTTGTSVVFGTDTFRGSENKAASIIGHELMHTVGADECEAYRWEAEHCDGTGVCPCDAGVGHYLESVLNYLREQSCP